MCFAFFLGLLGLAALAAGVSLGMYAWRNQQAASNYRKPLSRIAKLQPGVRRVKGAVNPVGEPLRSPLTNKPCVYFRLTVYEDKTVYSSPPSLAGGAATAFLLGGAAGVILHGAYDAAYGGHSRASSSWNCLSEEAFHVPSVIEDDTGWVELNFSGATVITKEKARIVTNSDHPLPAKLTEMLLDEYDIDTVDDRGWIRNLHIIEEALAVGTKVTIAGSVEPRKSGDLCFVRKGEDLVVSEGDIRKQSQKANTNATLCLVGASLLLCFALGSLVGAVVLFMIPLLSHK